jgi:hypothetical protein
MNLVVFKQRRINFGKIRLWHHHFPYENLDAGRRLGQVRLVVRVTWQRENDHPPLSINPFPLCNVLLQHADALLALLRPASPNLLQLLPLSTVSAINKHSPAATE